MSTDSDAAPRTPLYRNPFLWAFLVGIVLLTAIRPLLRHVPDPPPVTGVLPEFSLTQTSGERFTKDSLRGRIWIAAFVTARCAGDCQGAIEGMVRLQAALRERRIDRIRLLSIAGGGAGQTDPALAALAGRSGADPALWTFVSGDITPLLPLAGSWEEGPAGPRKVEAGTPEPGPSSSIAPLPSAAQPGGAGSPSRRLPLLLVDGEGHIRGRYAVDDLGLDEVFNRAQHLLREPPQP